MVQGQKSGNGGQGEAVISLLQTMQMGKTKQICKGCSMHACMHVSSQCRVINARARK